MKILFSFIFIILMSSSTLAEKSTVDLKFGSCSTMDMQVTFYPHTYKKGVKPRVLNLPQGCRCTVYVNGLEFLPSGLMPDKLCEPFNEEKE